VSLSHCQHSLTDFFISYPIHHLRLFVWVEQGLNVHFILGAEVHQLQVADRRALHLQQDPDQSHYVILELFLRIFNPFLRTSSGFNAIVCFALVGERFIWCLWHVGALKIRVKIQMYRNHTSKLYGFYVMKGMGYGVSESYGLWIEIPRLPTRWIEKRMGYKRVWVIRAIG